MAEIFLSWTSANREAVEPLAQALADEGLDIFNYAGGMALGEIATTLQREISEAKLIVVCFDDTTYNGEWIATELAWGSAAKKPIVPVWVGPHPQRLLPIAVDKKYPAFDMEQRTPMKVRDLAARIAMYLPSSVRSIVYGAVYSMTAEQFETLRVEDPVSKAVGMRFSEYLDKVCRQVGMPKRPELMKILARRYGASPDDVKPFDNGPTVAELVSETLEKVNRKREKKLFVRWVRDDLKGPEHNDWMDRWVTSESLLIVDALSLWCPDVSGEFEKTMHKIATTSIVWIPPFTQQTGGLYEMLNRSWKIIPSLAYEFHKWETDDPHRNVTCEVSTPFALGRWLHRTLASAQGSIVPLPGNLGKLPAGPPVKPFPS